jgi:3-phenylpropionate/cinnamic acid dioxygenase small subunit
MPNPTDDHLAIQEVMVRYAAGLDDGDFNSYRTCFMEDVELEGFGREPVRGLEAWLAFVARALEPYRATQHMLGVPKIAIDGDRASMRTDLQASHFPKDADAKTFILWATYETEVVRSPSGWRIQHHRLISRAQKFDGGIS